MARRLDLPTHFSFEDGAQTGSIAALLERLDSEQWRWGEVWLRFESGELERWLRHLGALELGGAVERLREEGSGAEELEEVLRGAVPVATGDSAVGQQKKGSAAPSPAPQTSASPSENPARRQRQLIGEFRRATDRRGVGETRERESAAAAEAAARQDTAQTRARFDAAVGGVRDLAANAEAALTRAELQELWSAAAPVGTVSSAEFAPAAAGAADSSARLLGEIENLERVRRSDDLARLSVALGCFLVLVLLVEAIVPESGLLLAPVLLACLIVIWRVRYARLWLDGACAWGTRRWAGRSSSDSSGSSFLDVLVALPLTLVGRATEGLSGGHHRAAARTVLLGYLAYVLIAVLGVGLYVAISVAMVVATVALALWLIGQILE